jgi:hypothetical protein
MQEKLIASVLTYMATILILEERGDLERVEVDLKPRDMPERSFYAFPKVIKWLDEQLPLLQAVLDENRQSPLEQVDFLLYEFIRGGVNRALESSPYHETKPQWCLGAKNTGRAFLWMVCLQRLLRCCRGSKRRAS